MDNSDFVIIGGVAAGPKTAATLARRMPNATITVFQKEDRISYGTCGMPYFASGDIDSFEELTQTSYGVARSPEFFHKSKGFEVTTGAEVINIDREKKTVTVKLLTSGETIEHGYGKLVIATGSSANRPPFPCAESPKISAFTRPDDAIAFRKAAQTGQVGKAVVIGGGFIGLEVSEAAGGLWGIEVALIERENQLLPQVLDPEMADLAKRELIRQDVDVFTGSTVEKVELDDNGNPVVYVAGKESITTDYVFLCLGVHPEIGLAKDCGLEIGSTGAIKVNEQMQTSDENIFAGGDCVESVNRVSDQPMYIPMGSLANRHGRVIAENLAGHNCSFPKVTCAFLVKVFDTNVGAVGLSEEAARKAGIPAASLWGTFPDKPDYYPESHVIVLKMIFNPENNRLLGLQATGVGDICRKIDVFSSFLQHGAKVEDLLDFEQGYAPPYSEALDPLHHLAGMVNARKTGIRFVNPGVVLSAYDGTQFIDVREPEEFEANNCSEEVADGNSVIHIPLNDLRERLSELDSSRKTLVICRRGPRSYQAAIILRSAGFEQVEILAGGLQTRE